MDNSLCMQKGDAFDDLRRESPSLLDRERLILEPVLADQVSQCFRVFGDESVSNSVLQKAVAAKAENVVHTIFSCVVFRGVRENGPHGDSAEVAAREQPKGALRVHHNISANNSDSDLLTSALKARRLRSFEYRKSSS